MRDIQIQITLHQLRNYKLKNPKIYFDIFFSNCRRKSKTIDTSNFMIQQNIAINCYIGEEVEIWMRDSETKKILGCGHFYLQNGHQNLQLHIDRYTLVGELIFKSTFVEKCIDKEEIIIRDEDFLKKEEKIDNEKELQEEAERLRVQKILEEEQNRRSNIKISSVLLSNKVVIDQNVF